MASGTQIPFSADTSSSGAIISGTAAATSMYFQNDGRTLLFALDPTGNTGTVVVNGVADPYGRTANTTSVTCTTGSLVKLGPFPTAAFNASDGTVGVTCTNVTTLKLWCVRI